MRRILSIALIFLVSWQFLLKGGIMLWFKINQDYIARTLCVNRDKPELTCAGKCFLTKELNKVDDQRNDAKLPIKTLQKLELSSFIFPTFKFISLTFSTGNALLVAPSDAAIASQFFERLLKPPQFLV